MIEIDAGPNQAMAPFEDALHKSAARFRTVRGKTASRRAAQGVRLAVAG